MVCTEEEIGVPKSRLEEVLSTIHFYFFNPLFPLRNPEINTTIELVNRSNQGRNLGFYLEEIRFYLTHQAHIWRWVGQLNVSEEDINTYYKYMERPKQYKLEF